jgi:hypothetical protein
MLRVFNMFSNSLLQVSVWRRPTLSPAAVCMRVSNSARMGSNIYCIMWVPGPVFVIFPIRLCIDIIYIATALCPTCITLHFNFSNVLLTVHLAITLVNDQLDAQLLYFIIRLLLSSTCFEQRRAHHQEVKFYYYSIWYSLSVSDCPVCRSRPAYRTTTYREWRYQML